MCSCFKSKPIRRTSFLAEDNLSPDALTQQATKAFKSRFGYKPEFAAQAPGRVNLIGEHTDYNDGFVFPMVTVIVGSATKSGTCRIETLSQTVDRPTYIEFPISDLQKGTPKWCNYVKGVVAQMEGTVPSFDAVIASSVPLGGGVSSSAAIEVATYTFIEQLEGVKSDIPQIEKILKCQKAEHEFANMPCGIMDQYISFEAKQGYAMFLDCRFQTAKLIHMADPDVVVLVTNSHIKHELTGSEYSTRKKQCQEGAKILGITSLRDATEAMLEAKKDELDEETYRRVRHVISEIKRTSEAADALEKGDYKSFGKHMVDSHNSLRDDYEVSCIELDQLVDYAMEMKDKGVFGSRMTGGGFGGCTVTLVEAKNVDDVIKHMQGHNKCELVVLYADAGPAFIARLPPMAYVKRMG